MRREMGNTYVDRVRSLYQGSIPGQSDLCCYPAKENENWEKPAFFTTDYTGFNGFHGEYAYVLSKFPLT